ncbi:LytR/AlgR family response regulator transcription factor [Flectobacillus major]|jgi:DNA-binding LytR/AlgR family response regulator|uniref:LytR/AlgR family response regulator transcription factor n=1 Tax=Flectobacillus major TaxID=103 RepID=UPI00040B057D|nr:LytTR family DNA-binding domain-containing protein [Flectobacillus major]
MNLCNKCLIIEPNDESSLDLLQHIEKNTFLDVVIVQNYEIAQLYLNRETFDIIFLSLQLTDQAGLVFIHNLPPHIPVIVVSSFREYAAQTYELDNVVDFLLKPISEDRVIKAINRAMKVQMSPNAIVNNQFAFIKVGRQIIRFDFNDIDFIMAFGNYAKIQRGKKTDVANESITVLSDMLPQDTFRRVHKSYIININKITGFDTKYFHIDTKLIPIGSFYKKSLLFFPHLRNNYVDV